MVTQFTWILAYILLGGVWAAMYNKIIPKDEIGMIMTGVFWPFLLIFITVTCIAYIPFWLTTKILNKLFK